MKRTTVIILCLVVGLVWCGAGMAMAAKAQKPAAKIDVNALLLSSFDLLEKGKYDQAEKLLDKILAEDPNNPLALNNLAAIMVKQKKFDKADTYLNEALPRARGYMVQITRVCQAGGICLAFKPMMGGTGNQELAPLIMLNIDMVKQYLAAETLSGKGPK